MLNPVLFPPQIASGAVGGPRFKTLVVGTHKGDEQRNIAWEDARGEWIIDRRHLHQADLVELNKFFYAHYGRGYAFLFKDWADYQARMVPTDNKPVLFTTAGGTPPPTQLVKTYAIGNLSYVRTIHRPVSGTITLYADEVPIGSSQYAIDYSTGIITWDSGYSPAAGLEITWDGEFHVPARFDTDYQDRRYLRGPKYEWPRVAIIEVRNEPDVA